MDDLNRNRESNELFMSSQLMMVVSHTIFSVILIIESFLLGWEVWAVILITAGVAVSWFMHITGAGSDRVRLWTVSFFMMANFFFYGSHPTSTYDLAIVISAVILLYTMTGIHGLITLCQITYYLTMSYAVVQLVLAGERFDPLAVSRTLLHFAMVTMICWISRTVIDKWNAVLGHSRDEINMLMVATQRLNDYLANVSHEIRTPINTILGLCDIGLDTETDLSKRARLLSIEDAGKKIGSRISDILDYSEIDRGDITNNCEDYMLSSLLNDIVNELAPYAKKNVELIIDVEPSIPSVMNTDVGKLKKILWHLITNGLKFTNEGGVYVHISGVPHDYGINLRIDITDTGIGMDAAQLEMIHDEFYKADSGRARKTGGLGLGMQIVHGFVKSLGGFMTVESKPDEGTTVKVSLPNRVVDNECCMSISDKENISLGAYLHFEKYPNPRVREFYDSMVRNIVTGLKVTMHRVDNTNSLRALTGSKKLTHLFAGPEEYLDAADLFEELAKEIIVTVIANAGEIELPAGSRVRIMPKPFYCFPVVGVLNSNPGGVTEEEGRVAFPGARVLVVDDEPMNLTVSMAMLKTYGMTVTTCGSGQAAVDLCRENEYDVVLMDHMMPVMDGVETMKRIRSEQARRKTSYPVIAYTANAVSSAREMFRREGFDGFVGKPVDRVELERVLKRVLPPALVQTMGEDDRISFAGPEDNSTETRPASVIESLASIGVDTEKGLYFSQGDKDFYETILAQYLKESDAKKQLMKDALASGDLDSYVIQIHSVKSTSKTIGASELSESARLLEEAGKNGDRGYIDDNQDAMLMSYDRILEVIKNTVSMALLEDPDMPDDEEEILEFDAVDNGGEGGRV